jgi:tetratricopeptide (TPR) repeat protein
MDFRFQLPKPLDGPLIELTLEEMETILIRNVGDAGKDPRQALWQLAQFYKVQKQHEKALELLRQLMALLPDVESKAQCVFTMGQAMEKVGDYAAAVRYYKEAFALEPSKTFTWYFIHNNLGFSLNTLGRFAEGEDYCREAIKIDPNRPNAHKNLGIALAGQGQFREAAQAFIAATQANAADPRALGLLENLLNQHPELEYEHQTTVEMCRQAVKVAADKAQRLKPTVHRGWRKQWVLLKMKLQSVCRRLGNVQKGR